MNVIWIRPVQEYFTYIGSKQCLLRAAKCCQCLAVKAFEQEVTYMILHGTPVLHDLFQRTTFFSRLLRQASGIEGVFLSGFLRATKQDSPSNETANPVLCVTEGVAGSKYTSYILIVEYDNAPHRVKCYELYKRVGP